ncbi:MAG: hypothetical protein NVS3B3_10670 [Aquirhabdus sp.]
MFLTPIFAKQIGVGFGVCEELAVFSQFKPSVTHPSSRHASTPIASHEDMSGMSMAEMPHMMGMQSSHSGHSSSHTSNHSLHHISAANQTSTVSASKVITPNLLQPQAEPHHQNHAKCEFCLLLGHSVLPPMHVVIAVLLTVLIAKITVKAKAVDAAFLNQNKNLRPQGRAPPVFIS